MISKHVIDYFLQIIDDASTRLKDYQPASNLYYLEARYALFELRTLLSASSIVDEGLLVIFFSGRWERILKNTDAQYLHDFTNPANQACIEIAKMLGPILNVPYLLLLMPTLRAVSPLEYITSSYMEQDLCLQALILSDDNERLLHIADILEGAQEDGVLKHNSLFDETAQVKPLSGNEIKRLLSRHQTVMDAHEALQTRVNYKLYGNTVGAALNRLIIGLRNGGVKRNGRELDSGCDANVAIVDFNEYLETLSEETKQILMESYKFDRFSGGTPEHVTVQQLWKRLARSVDVHYDDVNYCVELIASPLEEILNENKELYDLCSDKAEVVMGLSAVNVSFVSAMQMMKESLPVLTAHVYYGDTRDSEICLNLIRSLSNTKGFFLEPDDIVYFSQQYAMAKKKEETDVREFAFLLKSIIRIHEPLIVAAAQLKLTAEERQLFKLMAIDEKVPDPKLSASKFFSCLSSRKRSAAEDSILPNPTRSRNAII